MVNLTISEGGEDSPGQLTSDSDYVPFTTGQRFDIFHAGASVLDFDEAIAHLDSLRLSEASMGWGLNSPIHRVPEEILGAIFTLAIPGLRVKHNGPGFSPVGPGETHPHDVRLRLSQVCRMWTRVMYNTPRVWTTVVLDRCLPSDLSVVQSYLQKSKTCHLDLYINTSRWFQYSNAVLCAFFRILRLEVPRLRYFITFRPRQNLIAELFPCHIPIEAPRLEVFQLGTRDPSRNLDGSETELGLIQAPNLQILYVSNARILNVFSTTFFRRLRRLHLLSTSDISLPRFLLFLLTCPYIEALCLPLLEEWDSDDPQPIWPCEKIDLLSLKELRFSIHNSPSSNQLCQVLHIPALEVLDVVVAVNGSAVSRLEALLRDSVASLRHLCVRGPLTGDVSAALTGYCVLPFIHSLINLDCVRMDWVNLGKSFFTALTPDPTFPYASVPRKRLHLEFRDVTFDGDQLVRLIRARALAGTENILGDDTPLPKYFTTIRLDSCPGLKPHHLSEILQIQERTQGKALEVL